MEFENLKPLFCDAGPNVAGLCGVPVIAGPCSAESKEQLTATARGLKDAGITAFRAGIWKPRTRPGSFEGVGARGLSWLAEVKSKFNMPPAVEVATAAHLRAALRSGVRIFWIGARTSANPFAVQEIADLLAQQPTALLDEITVMVKNPVNPDLELWIGAMQRIYDAGVRRLGAIHRGFSAYGAHKYRNVPEWRIPFELKRRIPELPLWCDPSHIAGRRELVEEVAQQALCMNFDGLIIEAHCDPQCALSDAAQQLTPDELTAMLGRLRKRSCTTAQASLQSYRDEIDSIDENIMDLLARRMKISHEIGALKQREGIAVVQPRRYKELVERRVAQGEAAGLSPDFIRRYLSLLHEESVKCQITH